MQDQEKNKTVSLYVVKAASGQYFAGFDANKQQASFVDDLLEAKKFTNKWDIKLRPEENLVEILVDLTKSDITVSEPFRPQLRSKRT